MKTKVAVITGATRGIGRALALRLAAKGISIATVYSKNDEAAEAFSDELSKLGSTPFVFRCDVTDFAGLREFARHVTARLGGVDYLVNNVGVDVFERLGEVSFAEWRRSQDIILNAPLLLTQEFLPFMRRQHFGRIIMLGASSRDYDKGAAGLGPFGIHKAALKVLTRTLAMEEIRHGITVNMVAPGSTSGAGSRLEEERIPVSQIPVGRRISLEEVVAAMEYFLSDSSSAVTGQVLGVNGGMST